MNPATGRIVHFTLPGSTMKEPKVRPAIIVEHVGGGACHLEVFLALADTVGLKPNEVAGLKMRSAVVQSTGYPARPGEWQWPILDLKPEHPSQGG